MEIGKNTVVSIIYELADSGGNVLEKSGEPVSYLHGGYDNIFPVVEQNLEGKAEGDTLSVVLEPGDAFGEYDAELVRTEPRNLFPSEELQVGMQFEGSPEDSQEVLIYTVTDIAGDTVVVDGNHPLAGHSLNFSCTVMEVRAASEEEVEHGHVHGAHGHNH